MPIDSGPNEPGFLSDPTLFTKVSTAPFGPPQAALCIAIIQARLVASSGSWPVVARVRSTSSWPEAGVMRANHAGWNRLAGAVQVTSDADGLHCML